MKSSGFSGSPSAHWLRQQFGVKASVCFLGIVSAACGNKEITQQEFPPTPSKPGSPSSPPPSSPPPSSPPPSSPPEGNNDKPIVTYSGGLLTLEEGASTTFEIHATSPKGDNTQIRVQDRPAKGRVENSDGLIFRYRPAIQTSGTDRFSMIAIDSSGNQSEPKWIDVEIQAKTRATSHLESVDSPAILMASSSQNQVCEVYDNNRDNIGDEVRCRWMHHVVGLERKHRGQSISNIIGLFSGGRFICSLSDEMRAICWEQAPSSQNNHPFSAGDAPKEVYTLDVVKIVIDSAEEEFSVCTIIDIQNAGSLSDGIPDAVDCTDGIQGEIYAK